MTEKKIFRLLYWCSEGKKQDISVNNEVIIGMFAVV